MGLSAEESLNLNFHKTNDIDLYRFGFGVKITLEYALISPPPRGVGGGVGWGTEICFDGVCWGLKPLPISKDFLTQKMADLPKFAQIGTYL